MRKHGFLLDDGSQSSLSTRGVITNEQVLPRKEYEEAAFKQLCHWTVSSSLSFSCLEDREFRNFISILDPSFTIPARTTMSRRIRSIFEDSVFKMRDLLS